mgnify:CR=1 FL=1
MLTCLAEVFDKQVFLAESLQFYHFWVGRCITQIVVPLDRVVFIMVNRQYIKLSQSYCFYPRIYIELFWQYPPHKFVRAGLLCMPTVRSCGGPAAFIKNCTSTMCINLIPSHYSVCIACRSDDYWLSQTAYRLQYRWCRLRRLLLTQPVTLN